MRWRRMKWAVGGGVPCAGSSHRLAEAPGAVHIQCRTRTRTMCSGGASEPADVTRTLRLHGPPVRSKAPSGTPVLFQNPA
jgi:hypothetical protein